MAAVLEDCVDQLAVLGRIMPTSYTHKPDTDDVRFLNIYNFDINTPFSITACHTVTKAELFSSDSCHTLFNNNTPHSDQS